MTSTPTGGAGRVEPVDVGRIMEENGASLVALHPRTKEQKYDDLANWEAIAELKEALDINIELASPDQFIPPVPGWRDRSVHIGRHGEVDFYHFDPLSQALAKLARGHDRDVSDVRAMLERELFGLDDLLDGLAKIQPELLRHPALDASAFLRRVRSFAEDQRG